MKLGRKFFKFWIYLLIPGAFGVGIWQTVAGIENYRHGIYAGYHYSSALTAAEQVLVRRYGYEVTNSLHLAHPDVINTHTNGGLLTKGHQIRVFHFIGPRGVKYCVGVWGGINANKGTNFLKKGCSF